MLRPWFVSAVRVSPLSAGATGGCVAAALLTANLLSYAGERLDLLLCMPILIGYVLAAAAWNAGTLERDLDDLRGVLRCSDAEYAEILASMGRYRPALLWGATGAGIAVSLALGLTAGPSRAEPSAWLALLVGESFLFWSLAVPVMAVLVLDAARFRRLGRESLAPRIFEPELLASFGRRGLRGSLVILGIFGVRILFYAVDAPRTLVLANLAPMLAAAVLATLALLLPSLGARDSLRAAKRLELDRVRDALARQPFAPGSSLAAGIPRAYLDLLEYRERVAAVREWPLGAPAILRFALYLLIPVGGWLGGAVMERALSWWLDR